MFFFAIHLLLTFFINMNFNSKLEHMCFAIRGVYGYELHVSVICIYSNVRVSVYL